MIPIARPLIGDDEKNAVLEVMSSGQFAQGPKVREFEAQLVVLNTASPLHPVPVPCMLLYWQTKSDPVMK